MATKAKKGRSTSSKRRRTRRSGGVLHGISLGNLKKTNKKEVFDMLKTGGAIVLGWVVGEAGGKLIKKQFAQGDQQAFQKWIEPLVQLGAGFLISQTGKKNEFVRVMGAGIAARGVATVIETATGKTIMDLIGMGEETAQGVGTPAIEDVDFEMNLPELSNVDTRGDDIPANIPEGPSDFSGTDEDDVIL